MLVLIVRISKAGGGVALMVATIYSFLVVGIVLCEKIKRATGWQLYRYALVQQSTKAYRLPWLRISSDSSF